MRSGLTALERHKINQLKKKVDRLKFKPIPEPTNSLTRFADGFGSGRIRPSRFLLRLLGAVTVISALIYAGYYLREAHFIPEMPWKLAFYFPLIP